MGLSTSYGMYKSLYICLVYYFLEPLDLPVILQQKKIPNIRIHTCQNWPSTPSLETSWVTTLYGMLLTLTWQIQASPYYETLLELQQSEEILSGAWFSIIFRSTAQSMKEGLHMRGCRPLMITKSVWSWIDTERTRQKCNSCKWEKSVPIRTFPTAFLSYKISNNKIPKFPNNLWATRISLVGTWTCKYKGHSSQFYNTKCVAAIFSKCR